MGKLSAGKAREMIENPPHGKPLTGPQNRYFHAVAKGEPDRGGEKRRPATPKPRRRRTGS
jgi:hypothetical protein